MEFPTSATDILFYVFASVALVMSLFVVLGRNPISSAFSLILVFFAMAATFALQQAHFIAAIQILVYAGAIMVLFTFVIMLLNADLRNFDLGKHKPFQLASAGLCVVLLAMFVWILKRGQMGPVKGIFSPERVEGLGGNVQVISQLMFSDYILPFELTSILLLVGIVGSVALAKRKQETRK